jgi:hypothetical protein
LASAARPPRLKARPALKELLAPPLQVTPIIEASRRGVWFEGAIGIDGFSAGNVEV